jgi:hypothetical protein
MAIAEGIRKSIIYKKETSFGGLAGATGGKTARRVTGSFNLSKETYESGEIRTDYQVADFRHGVKSVEGNIDGELSAGSYSDLIASSLARNFTAVTSTATGSITIAAPVNGVYGITRTTGSYLTDGVRVGNVISLAGMNVNNNTKRLLIVALTATIASVVVISGTVKTLTPETVATGGSYTVAGKTTYAPITGHTDDSYTVEEFYLNSPSNISEVYTGNKINTVGISLPATGLVTCKFGFMGKNLEQTGTAAYFTNPTAQGTSGIFASVNGALVVNGVAVALVTQLNININRNISGEATVGSDFKPELNEGRISVDGDFSTLFQDRTISDYFKDEVEVSLVVALSASSADNSDFISLTLPRIKVNSDTKDDGEKQVVAANSFKALLGSGANGFQATTLQIQDSLA